MFKRGIAPKYIYREFKRDEVPSYEFGASKRGFAPLLIFPPPLIREGDKGGGFPNKNKILKEMRSINNLYNTG